MASGEGTKRRFLKWFKRTFLSGLILILPIAITLYILYRIFAWIDRLLKPVIVRYPFLDVPGLGFLVVIVVIIAAGLVGRGIIGRTVIRLLEGALERIPMVSGIYKAIKQISEVFLREDRTIFERVVMVEYPRQGLYMLGFVTSRWRLRTTSGSCEDLNAVFIPTSPNPTSGFLVIVSPREMIPTELSVQEAFEVIISGGAISPDLASKQGESSESP